MRRHQMADVDGTEDAGDMKVWRLELAVKLSMLPRTLSLSPMAEMSSRLKSCVASTTSSTLRPIDWVSASNCCSSAVSLCSKSAVCDDRSDSSDTESSSIYTPQTHWQPSVSVCNMHPHQTQRYWDQDVMSVCIYVCMYVCMYVRQHDKAKMK